jgi:DNA-binding response OmpR family regulator
MVERQTRRRGWVEYSRRRVRRSSGAALLGDLLIDVACLEATRDGLPLPLTRTEFKLLAELAGAEGAICSREHLLSKVWGYGHFGDSRIVDVHVRRLRLKVEHDPANPQHVVTARGLGYRLKAASVPLTVAPSSHADRRPRSRCR